MTFKLITNISSVKVREYNKEYVSSRWKAEAMQGQVREYLIPLDANVVSIS